jgi:hypothetical protein
VGSVGLAESVERDLARLRIGRACGVVVTRIDLLEHPSNRGLLATPLIGPQYNHTHLRRTHSRRSTSVRGAVARQRIHAKSMGRCYSHYRDISVQRLCRIAHRLHLEARLEHWPCWCITRAAAWLGKAHRCGWTSVLSLCRVKGVALDAANLFVLNRSHHISWFSARSATGNVYSWWWAGNTSFLALHGLGPLG